MPLLYCVEATNIAFAPATGSHVPVQPEVPGLLVVVRLLGRLVVTMASVGAGVAPDVADHELEAVGIDEDEPPVDVYSTEPPPLDAE